ncbi:MAG: trigger factor [Rugosibacter sp.]
MTDMATAEAPAEAKSALERRIEFTVTMADIEPDIEFRLKKISRTVKMPGFRPGKVPMKMVEQQYGGQARYEAIGAAVETVLGLKLEEQKLRIAGQPNIESAPDAGEGKLGFSAVFEVYPQITLADISGQSIEKPTLIVTDAEVGQTIETLRKQRVNYVEADRAAQKDDRVVIDFIGRKDGVEFSGGKADDYAMVVGAGTMLPDFEAAVEGVKAGDKKTFEVKFPDDYQAKELAGSTAQFDILVKKVEAPQLPALDAEFAKAMGVADGNVDTMRAEVKANLEREVKKRLQAKVKQQVMDLLLEVNNFDVPKALVETESQQLAEGAQRDMESRGMSVKGFPMDPAWFADKAVRRVRLGLLLADMVNVKGLRATPEQVRAVVDEFAASFEDPKEVVRWYYSQPQRMAEAEALAIENNVVEWVLGNVKVTEKSMPFDELMGNKAS